MSLSSRRFSAAALSACLLLTPAALRAQTAGVPAGDVPLDPMSPLADMPDIGVDWPTLDETPQGADPASTARAQVAAETRYSFKLEGLDGVGSPLFRQRFAELSALDANDDQPANAAQIDRRAREDAELLDTLLRAEGYYAARVSTRVEPQGQGLLVTLVADTGPLYRLKQVDLAGVDAAGDKAGELRDAFGLKPQAPANADEIVAAEARLRAEAGAKGFPFARVGEPELTVDHATRTATLDLSVQPGGARRIGKIVTPNERVFDARHIQEIARFAPGDPYEVSDMEDLRRALVQTGLVSSAQVTPVEGATPDTVDVSVALEPAPPRTIAGELGYGTGEGARAEVSWTHRNFFPPEGAVTLRGVLGTREYLANIIFRRNNFQARDRVLTLQATAAHLQRDAYEADTLNLSATLERQTNIFFQKEWAWSIGAELVASDERDVDAATGLPRRQTYFVGALPLNLIYDASDDLLNPTRGFRLGGRVSPELSLVGSVFGYARAQIDASFYQPVGEKLVLAARARLGSIVGAPRDAIAPSRRFYAGGGASVRGYSYQSIGPRDPNNDPLGGRSLTEFALEARVKAFGNFSVVPFLDAGNIYGSALPRFSDFRFGAGVGVRYLTNFGPIRVDVGTPLNPQPGDTNIAVYVSLGQAF